MNAVVDHDPFGDAPLGRVVPTTEPQREVWLASQLGVEASLAYNESVSLRLRGPLDIAALRGVLQDLVDRHDALRATISADGQSLYVSDAQPLMVALADLTELPPDTQDAGRRRALRDAVEQPFDLERGPLVRAELLAFGPADHLLVLTAHHIVCDGWSFGVLVTELLAFYEARAGQGGVPLPEPDSFADYALAQWGAEQSVARDADCAYWVSVHDRSVPVLDLPTDRARKPVRSVASLREDLTLDARLVDAVRKLGAARGASLFVTLFGMFAAMLSRLGSSDGVVVGIPAAGQAAVGAASLVGHCVSLLPIRVDVDLEQDVETLLRTANARVLDAYEHQHCTFGSLLKKLQVERDPSRMPLVSVLFNLDASIATAALSDGELRVEMASNPRHFETFELFVNATQVGGAVVLECQYHTHLFDASTVRRWLELYRVALERAVAEPSLPLALTLAPAPEDACLLARFNRTAVDRPRDLRIESLVAQQAARSPDRIAVCAGDSQLSYRELDQRANALAARLQAIGVTSGSLVGLACGRNQHMLVGLLGILKSGAGYVPLDPAFPADRLQFMVSDAKLHHVVTDHAASDCLPLRKAERLFVEDLGTELEAPPSGDADGVAYVIYTSGSTGRPKGVMVPHAAVVNFLASMARTPGMTASDRLVAVTTLSFDIAVLELLLPLCVGAQVVLAGTEHASDPHALSALLRDSRATVMQATPGTWRMLLDAGWQGSPGFKALVGGEALPLDLAASLIPAVGELWNMYGPTETTVWSTCTRLRDLHSGITIGQPIANTRVHILDDRLRECPIGVAGEIWIAGDGVTLGYLGRADLTEERFLPDPMSTVPGARRYKTGDIGRWRADGLLECLGRTDQQVKVRGYRIELGEIEANLVRHPDVDRAVVTTREHAPGDVRLIAYVVSRGKRFDAGEVRDFLRSSLPEYMLPQHVVQLDAIPLLPNGKIDRKSLPAPGTVKAQVGTATQPCTPMEIVVAGVMESVLALPGIGTTDSFFSLGGHSLLAAQLASQLGKALGVQLPLRAIFEAPTVQALAARLDAGAQPGNANRWTIDRRADRTTAPVSLMQHRLWYLEQLDPGRVIYNTPSAHRLRGRLDELAFERAFAQVVQRQDSLRSVIVESDGGPVQAILPEVPTSLLPAEDLRAVPAAQRENALLARLEALAGEPFDLAQAPLFRARLFRTADDEYVFYFGPHHIIWDGWSFDLFYEEMSAHYAALREGREPSLPELPIAYGDFAAWHRDWMQGDELATQLAHWKERLAGTFEPLAIPVDRARPAEMSGEGATTWLSLPVQTTDMARRLARSADATSFMVLLAAYALTLHQLTGQQELVVGVPVRGRQLASLEKVMGLFVNALPLRLRVDPDVGFTQLLASVRDVVVDAFKHPDVPFEELVRELRLPRDRSRHPVYQALFSFQDARERPQRWGDLEHDMVHVMQPGLAEDLSLWLMERPTGLVGGLAYNTDILTSRSAERIRDRFAHVLDAVIADPHTPVGELPLAEREARDLAAWNATGERIEGPATVHERVLIAPAERIALVHAQRRVTYGELEASANRLAHALRGRGARRGARIGLCIERGVDMVVALLAVLKSGAAYVPLDPSYPADRLRFMAEDAGLAVLVTQSSFAHLTGVTSDRILLVDANAAEIAAQSPAPLPAGDDAAGPDDCAYVIYTSGTTGKPKGVMVPHRAVLNFLASMARTPGLTAQDRLAAVTTLSFDIAVLELLLPLAVGAQIVMADSEHAADPRALATLLRDAQATVMQATPGTWRMLLDDGWRGGPGFKALVGGEALPADLAGRLIPAVGELWNMYGPTETTVWSTCAHIRDLSSGITIGRPIANTQVHILDERRRECPIGVIGEIWIAGKGVALGYLNRPELTAERFIGDSVHGRLYRTGDRGRWCADGQLEHMGRNDFQVKVRGYRIELGEIEACIATHPAVRQAVVTAREHAPGDVRLVAYYTAHGGRPNADALREHLRSFLPTHMLPQHFVPIDTVPLLPNGKINRAALPAPESLEERSPAAGATPATTDTEKQLAGIWAGLLKTSDITVQDNFFDIGGHSLLAMQAMLAMEKKTGKRIDRSRFVFETLGQIARAYDEARIEAAPKPGGLRRLLRGVLGRPHGS